jgi:hypothetical protein
VVTAGIAAVLAPVAAKPASPVRCENSSERVVAPIIPATAAPWPGRRLPWFVADTDYRSEAVNSRHAAAGTLSVTPSLLMVIRTKTRLGSDTTIHDATLFGCVIFGCIRSCQQRPIRQRMNRLTAHAAGSGLARVPFLLIPTSRDAGPNVRYDGQRETTDTQPEPRRPAVI